MAQNCKIIQFPGNNRVQTPAQSVSSELSARLGNVRENLGINYASSDVVYDPLVSDYEPQFHLDGTMQLGEEGMKDFYFLYGEQQSEGTAADWLGMYTVYYAYYASIRAVVKSPQREVHSELLRVAKLARDGNRIVDTDKDLHDIEDDITGWYAATQARRCGMRIAKTLRGKQYMARYFYTTSQEALNGVRSYTGRSQEIRNRVLGHFTFKLLGSDQIEPQITRILQAGQDRTRYTVTT